MASIFHIDKVGWAIEQLLEEYNKGNIKGLMFQHINLDGTFICCTSGDLSYIEKLGLLESTKGDVIHSASSD